MISISTFSSILDSNPKLRSFQWEDFKTALASPAVVSDKKEQSLFSPARYNNGKTKHDVVEVTMLVLDYDHGISDIEQALAPWKSLGLESFYYTTFQATAAEPRLRVCLPLKKPLAPEEYSELWAWAEEMSGALIDRATKNVNRGFFMPCVKSRDAYFKCGEITGKWLDWEMFKPEKKKVELSAPPTLPARPKGERSAQSYFASATIAEIGNVYAAPEGSRNVALNASAFRIAQLAENYGVDVSGATDGLIQAGHDVGLDKAEVISTVNSGLRAGLASPRDPSRIPDFSEPNHEVIEFMQAKVNSTSFEGELELLFDKKVEALEKAKLRNSGAAQSFISTEEAPPKNIGLVQETLTDRGAAMRFITYSRGDLVYLPEEDSFLIWNGKYWDGEHAIGKIAAMHEQGVVSGAFPVDQPMAQFNVPQFRRMIDALKLIPDIYAKSSAFDSNPDLINTPNGVVDLRTGELKQHERKYLFRGIGPVSPDFNIGPPKRFLKFLEEIASGDMAIVEFYRRFFGYALTGHTSAQMFTIFFGHGSNGKSTLIDLVSEIFGRTYVRHIDASTIVGGLAHEAGPRPDIVRLKGARLVFCSETNSQEPLNEAMVKKVTGGDVITARGLNQSPIEFIPTFKLVMATNHLPRLTNSDYAMQRRICTIPFMRSFRPGEGRVDNLIELLREEKEAILAWFIGGAMTWYSSGGQLGTPDSAEIAKREYIIASDSISRFLSEAVVQDDYSIGTSTTSTDELYRHYRAWTKETGEWSELGKTRSLFENALRERGITLTKSGVKFYFTGTIRKNPSYSLSSRTGKEI